MKKIEKLTKVDAKSLQPGTPIYVNVEEGYIVGIALFIRYDEKENKVYAHDAVFNQDTVDDIWFDLEECYLYNPSVIDTLLLKSLQRV